MLSQSSQERVGPLCLQLVKYSYATVSTGHVAPIPWLHLSRQHNLVVVFDTLRAQSSQGDITESTTFKIMKEAEVLELLCLEKLASAAHMARDNMMDPTCPTRVLEVAVVIRAPVIAIRYPSAGGQVKRFQIRFAEEEDYHEAMKWFARAKIPTEDAGYLSLQRPDTARSTTSTGIMPSDSVSQIATCPPTASTVPTVTPSHTPHTAIGQQHTIVAPSGPSIQQIHQAACDPVGRSYQTANQPEFQHNPITPMRPGLVENTYFAPVNTTGTIGCLNVATPLVNMYQPRPSTAPQLTRQPLSEILPPKPHFAFLGPPPVKDLNHEDSMAISETSHQTPVEMENELCSQASNVTTQATSPSKTKRPRTKSTTKPKAPKGPRKDTSNLVKSPRKAQDTQGSTIPSIDDILVRSADSQLPTSIPARPELDTQVLLEKAVARTTRGESDLHSRLLPSEVPASQPGQADTTVVEDNFSNLSTAINQSGANSTTRSAIDLSNPYAPAPPHPFDPDTLTILPRNTIPPNMTTTPIPLTSLPRNQQDVLLGSYIKTLFKDPSFLTMCQMMENSPDLRRLTQAALRL